MTLNQKYLADKTNFFVVNINRYSSKGSGFIAVYCCPRNTY